MKKSLFLNSRPLALILIAAILSAIWLTGCTSNAGRQTNETAPPTSAASETVTESTPEETTPTTAELSPVEQHYRDLLDQYLAQLPAEPVGQLAVADAQSQLVAKMRNLFENKVTSQEIFELFKQGITQLAPENADRFAAYAISGLRRNSFNDYVEIEQNYTKDPAFIDKFFKAAEPYQFNYLALHRQVDQIQDSQVKALVQRAAEQGYYAASTEGMIYYLVDFSEIARYRTYLTPAMADLVVSLAIDTLDPMAADGALIISRETLAARTYGLGQMADTHRGTVYGKHLAVRFRDHLTMLLYGLDNTPNFDYQTELVNDEAKQLYSDVASMDQNFLGQLVAEFQAIVAANDNKINDLTREKAQALFDAVDQRYGIGDSDREAFGQWMSGEVVSAG